jgi:hypothetical protein
MQVYDTLEQNDPANERQDPPNHILYRALGKLFPHADESPGIHHDTPANSRTIASAAMHCVTLMGMDVISLFRIRLRKPIINNMDPESQAQIKERRNGVTAIHVRKGDVSAFLFDGSTFRPRFEKVVKALHYYCINPLRYDEAYNQDMLKEYDWAQAAYSSMDIANTIRLAHLEKPSNRIEIVIAHVDEELQALVNGLKESLSVDIAAYGGESEMQSLARMASAENLYICNSYMGLLAGMLADPSHTTVHYPPNAMFAFFGLHCSCVDISSWKLYNPGDHSHNSHDSHDSHAKSARRSARRSASSERSDKGKAFARIMSSINNKRR